MILIESLGVNEVIEKYYNIILDSLIKDFDIIKSNIDNKKSKLYVDNNLEYYYSNINKTFNFKNKVDNDDYQKLPIKELFVNINVYIFNKDKKLKLNKKGSLNLDYKTDTITKEITGVTINIEFKIDLTELNQNDIKISLSPIIHELHHLLELTHLKNSKNKLSNSFLKDIGLQIYNGNNKNNNILNDFNNLIYYSFKHEFNARIPQIYSTLINTLKIDNNDFLKFKYNSKDYQKEFFIKNKEIILKTIHSDPIYIITDKLKKFNGGEYYNELLNKFDFNIIKNEVNQLILSFNERLGYNDKNYKIINNENDLKKFFIENEKYFHKTAINNKKRIYRTISQAIKNITDNFYINNIE